jgi:hypothetical protein
MTRTMKDAEPKVPEIMPILAPKDAVLDNPAPKVAPDPDDDFPSTQPARWKEWKELQAEREAKKAILKPIPPPPP